MAGPCSARRSTRLPPTNMPLRLWLTRTHPSGVNSSVAWLREILGLSRCTSASSARPMVQGRSGVARQVCPPTRTRMGAPVTGRPGVMGLPVPYMVLPPGERSQALPSQRVRPCSIEESRSPSPQLVPAGVFALFWDAPNAVATAAPLCAALNAKRVCSPATAKPCDRPDDCRRVEACARFHRLNQTAFARGGARRGQPVRH